MSFYTELRIIGDDIFYKGVKVASIVEYRNQTAVENFKRFLHKETSKQEIKICSNCDEEYLYEE